MALPPRVRTVPVIVVMGWPRTVAPTTTPLETEATVTCFEEVLEETTFTLKAGTGAAAPPARLNNSPGATGLARQ